MAGAIRVKGSETGFTELRANENATDNVIILPTDGITVASEEYVQLQLEGLELDDLANVDVDGAGENSLLAFDGEEWIATSEPVVDKVGFETQSPPALTAEGEIGWDDLDRALAYRTNNTIIDIGQENVVLIRNNTGSQLDKGTSVCVSGASSQRISVVKSDATPGLQGCRTIGVTLEDIPNNSFGLVSTFGMVRGINTSAFNEGDELFISTTPGVLTNTPPASPARRVTVGYVVIKGAGNGAIFVTIRRGLWLREVDDVNADSPTDGQVLSYNNSAGVWNPASLSTTDISEGTNLYYTDQRVLSVAVDRAGDTMTGILTAPNYNVGVQSETEQQIFTVDFSSGQGLVDLENDPNKNSLDFLGSNYTPGAIKTIRVENVNTSVSEIPVFFPSEWKFVGKKPNAIAQNKVAILTLTSFRNNAAGVVAGWIVEE